jgi:hypothetical protein
MRLGEDAPGTSNTVPFKKNSDSNRGDVKVGGLAGRTDVSTTLTWLCFSGDDSGVLKDRGRGEENLAGTAVYESGLADGDPGLQRKFQPPFRGDVSLAGGADSLVPFFDFSSRSFLFTDLGLDLIFLNSPVLACPSSWTGCTGITGEMTTEVSSCSSSLHVSPNLDA